MAPDARSRTALLTLAALGLASGACPGGEAGDGRYVRRLTPFSNEWALVSREPTRAEKGIMEIWEVSEFAPGTQPTPEHRDAARRLIERCEQAVRKHGWEDYEKGRADGFEPLPNDHRHYYNARNVFDDRVLDPERPEFLMYYDTPEGKRLVGFMFYVAAQADRGPQIAGPLTVWHYHLFSRPVCPLGLGWGREAPARDRPAAGDAERGRCVWGTPTQRSPEMLHVWLIRHPTGSFGTRMRLSPEHVKQALEERDRARAGA